MAMMLALFVLYGLIWLVPLSINFKRRRSGKKPYWLLFVFAMILEIFSLWLFLSLFALFDADFFGMYLSPIISAIAAGYFYWAFSERNDADAVA